MLSPDLPKDRIRETARALRVMHRIATLPTIEFQQQVRAMLLFGRRRFGLPVGILSRVEGERYAVVDAVAPDAAIVPGATFDLGVTCCREALAADVPVALENEPGGTGHPHPAYTDGSPQTYLGAPVRVRGRVFGTLDFCGPAPRSTTFAEADRELIRLMAQQIGAGLRHRQTEESLEESRRRYSLATAAAGVGIWDWDVAGGRFYLDPNVKALLGYSDDEIPNDIEIWSGYVHPDDREAVMQAAQAHMENRTPVYLFEHRMMHKDGSVRWFLVRGHAIRDRDGNVVRMVGTDSDITERKRMEEERRDLESQVQHAQRMDSLGLMAGGIAHDFNNLLTGVLGHASLLLHELPPISTAWSRTKSIERAAERAADLTRQLLEYTGKARLEMAAVDLNVMVREIRRILGPVVSKNATIVFRLDDDLPTLKADPTQIRQVIMNLVTNASEALEGQPGTIVVATGRADRSDADVTAGEPPGSDVYLEVSDTGAGMDEATRDRMFDPFFSTKFTGRGLGLAAVQGIVKGHRGSIEVSTEPGRGTRVQVLFSETAAPIREARQPQVAREWRGRGTVLVVDDEEIVKEAVGTILQSSGFEVLLAGDGTEALEILSNPAPTIDVVLLDLTMPRMDGRTALPLIRRLKPEVPVILMSGYSKQQATRQLGEGTPSGFIQKPCSRGDLLDELRAALGERS